jgi:hypothetical protein
MLGTLQPWGFFSPGKSSINGGENPATEMIAWYVGARPGKWEGEQTTNTLQAYYGEIKIVG